VELIPVCFFSDANLKIIKHMMFFFKVSIAALGWYFITRLKNCQRKQKVQTKIIKIKTKTLAKMNG
jgi:hypothetical protein